MLKNSKFFYGYASIFNHKDLNGDIIIENSFKWNVNFDIPLLLEHNPRKKIGRILKIIQNYKGLFVEGMILKEYSSKELKLSVGYVLNDKFIKKDGTRILTDLTLFEISLVERPANKMALALCV